MVSLEEVREKNFIFSSVCLGLVIISFGCTLSGGGVKACEYTEGNINTVRCVRPLIGSAGDPFAAVGDWKEHGVKMTARWAIVLFELVLIGMSIFLLVFRLLKKTTKENIVLIGSTVLTFFGAIMESCYSSGAIAHWYEEQNNGIYGNYIYGGVWTASAVFLWFSLFGYVADLVLISIQKGDQEVPTEDGVKSNEEVSTPNQEGDQTPNANAAGDQTPNVEIDQAPKAEAQTPNISVDQAPSIAAGQTPNIAAGQTPNIAAGQTPNIAFVQTPKVEEPMPAAGVVV